MVDGSGELRTLQRNVTLWALFSAMVTGEGATTNAGASARENGRPLAQGSRMTTPRNTHTCLCDYMLQISGSEKNE